jgi:GAF domain-containing protein
MALRREAVGGHVLESSHMPFAAQLLSSFDELDSRNRAEPRTGGGAEPILDEYLRKVEAAADAELLTSILLLDESGRRLVHGAAPSLPKAYCEAIDGVEIGPAVGSCGTAAFVGHSIYVTDIASDPLWASFRDVALEHGLRACWSTPIFDESAKLIGTFAIYYRTPRAPQPEEIEAINRLSERVARVVRTHR